jgi:hypothetical protein
MFPRSFRPQLEELGSRVLPSATPTISIGDASVMEGDSGQTALVFTVSLSKASHREVSVYYATDNGAAIAGSDYVPTAGMLRFAPGETTKTITVLVNGDAFYEEDEYILVDLSGASGAKIADAIGVGLILNDDVFPDGYTGGCWCSYAEYGYL